MKKLDFQYEMRLAFENPVRDHHFRFRCLPFEDDSQRCYGLDYGIEPSGSLRELKDGFGNRVCVSEAIAPHDFLYVWVRGCVFVDRQVQKKEEAHPLFLFSSELTRPNEELACFLRETEIQFDTMQKELRKGFPFACFLMHRLHEVFSYMPGRTDVKTTAAEAFAGKEGVCQDYAHILIALLRMAGYPARYVAGFMIGEGATHAWVEVYIDGIWKAIDPTHDRVVDDDYIKLSHGRDFGDCSVDRGCFKGYTTQSQEIFVKVR